MPVDYYEKWKFTVRFKKNTQIDLSHKNISHSENWLIYDVKIYIFNQKCFYFNFKIKKIILNFFLLIILFKNKLKKNLEL